MVMLRLIVPIVVVFSIVLALNLVGALFARFLMAHSWAWVGSHVSALILFGVVAVLPFWVGWHFGHRTTC